ncbi:MAG: AI-2E family transporter [Verrucomicrobiota bacterium]
MESANSTDDQKGTKMLFTAAAVVVVVAGLKLSASIMVPFFLALFLAVLSFPVLFWLKKKGVPTWLSILGAVLANLAVVMAIVLLAIQSVSDFQEHAPKYIKKFELLVSAVQQRLQDGTLPGAEYITVDLINPAALLNIAQDTLGQVVSVFSNGFLVVLIMIFVLGEATTIPEKFRFIMGQKGNASDPGRFQKITHEIVQYLGIKTLVSLGTGLLIGLGTHFIGLDFPVLWGLVAFALNYVPTIGSVIAAVPAVLLAIIQPGDDMLLATGAGTGLLIDWGRVIAVAVLYVAANITFGNFVEPMLMGRRLGLSTVVITLSLVFWGWMWGPIGMLLSVPLTMVVKIMLENTNDLRWVAVLLSQWPIDMKYLESKDEQLADQVEEASQSAEAKEERITESTGSPEDSKAETKGESDQI